MKMFEVMPGFALKTCKEAYIRDLVIRVKHLTLSIIEDYLSNKETSNPILLLSDVTANYVYRASSFIPQSLECYKDFLSYNDKIESELLDDIEQKVKNTINSAGVDYYTIVRKIEETGSVDLELLLHYYNTLEQGVLKAGMNRFFEMINGDKVNHELPLIQNMVVSVSDYLELYLKTIKTFLAFGSSSTKPIIEVMADIININISLVYKYVDYLYHEKPENKEIIIVLISLLGFLLNIMDNYRSLYNKSLLFETMYQNILDNCTILFDEVIKTSRKRYTDMQELRASFGLMIASYSCSTRDTVGDSIAQGLKLIMF